MRSRISHWVLIAAPLLAAAGLFARAFEPGAFPEQDHVRVAPPAFTPLPTGTFQLGIAPVNCSSIDPTSPLANGTVVCKSFTVSGCDGTVTLGGHVEIAEKTAGDQIGTISYYKGGSGTAFYDDVDHVNLFRAQGYRTIRIRWNSDWVNGDAAGESLRHAGCRPATVAQWIKTTYGVSEPVCAVGISGGASQIAVNLAHYDGETMLDYVQLETGPPHARIDEGCNPPESYGNAPMSACPVDNFPPAQFPHGVPYDYSLGHYEPPDPPPPPNKFDPTFGKMDDAHGIPPQDRQCGQPPNQAALTTFAEGSIISSSSNGWDNNYSIPVDMYICSNGINGANVGGLWFEDGQEANSVNIKCYGDGSKMQGPGPEESWCFAETIKSDEAALEDMKTSMLQNCQ